LKTTAVDRFVPMTKFNQSTPNKQKEVDLLRQPLFCNLKS
jgi:hypothetical protein